MILLNYCSRAAANAESRRNKPENRRRCNGATAISDRVLHDTLRSLCSLSDVRSYKKLKSLTGSSRKLSRGELPRRLGDLGSPLSRGSFNRVVLTRL